LDQSLESPFEAPSPHHEVSITSSDQEDPLNDIIERIEKMNLDAAPSQSVEQLGLS